MTRNRSWLGAIGIAFALTGATALTSMTGCKSGGLSDLLGSRSAMDLLSPLVKDAANSYIGNLTSLTDSLGNLQSLQGVLDFAKQIEPLVRELTSAYDTLAATSGKERGYLIEAFGSQLESVNSTFIDKAGEATGNRVWGSVLSQAIDQVKLFQPG